MQYPIKKFEELTNAALYKMLQLRQEIFIIEQTCIYPDIDGKDENAYHLLVFDEDSVIGCLRILGKGVSFEEVAIGRVIVSKSSRGQGIAKEMMLQALDFIKEELKEKRVKISAQAVAIPFYEGVGFKIVSEEYLEDDIPHVDMLWDLTE